MEDYISRKAVKQVLCGIANGLSVGEAEALKTKDVKALYKIKGAKEILNAVDDDLCFIPAADVQPVKHGEWEKKSSVGVFRCSLCQHIFMLGADEIDEYHFCPNCGARLDGDTVLHDRCSNYMDCDGSCFIDDTPCNCGGNIEKCKGR